jgi:SAM-dependent methyltransferase
MVYHEKLQDRKQDKILSILNQAPLSVQNNTLCFFEGNCLPYETAGSGILAFLQNIIKSKSRIYYFIVDMIAPVKCTRKYHILLRGLLHKYGENHVIVNYGSGPQILHRRHDIINTDLFAFNKVDIVFNTILPFKADTVDLFVNIAVLEHMQNPQVAVSEMLRCLKPGGELLVYVPFTQPIHSAPNDYYRWTAAGLGELFKGFLVVDVGVGAGPMSGFLWVFQEWLSILLSFGNSALKDLVMILTMLITFPFKYLDVLLERYPAANKIASGFYIYARKPSTSNNCMESTHP